MNIIPQKDPSTPSSNKVVFIRGTAWIILRARNETF